MNVRLLTGLAVGDFRDRVRRPAYAVTLLAAIGLGYLAVPNVDSTWVIMDVGGNRGVYNSAYVGAVTALAGALWLTFGGFYVVRSGIARDETSRVGQILAATPLRTSSYLLGKFLSNLLVLASMTGVLAVTALVMQLARGENRSVDPVALVEPFVLLSLPVMALTAAAAILFETVPLLRAGFGNVVWFVLALAISIGGQSASAPFGGLGVNQVAQSLNAALENQHLQSGGGGFSLGLTKVSKPLGTFLWDGFDASGGFVLGRVVLVLLACAVALLPALWFGRFDPARAAGSVVPAKAGAEGESASSAVESFGTAAPEPAPAVTWSTAPGALPTTQPTRAGAFGRLLVGEVRILLQGVSPWWWAVAGALTVAGFALPMDTVTGMLLPGVWLWPVLIWSRLGSQQVENGLEVLLGAYPTARRRLLAEWGSGLVLTAVMGVAPLVRMLAAGDGPGVACWVGGVLFIPSLAMSLGVLSRTHRVFQAIYLPIWYILVNNVAALDFMGAVRVDGKPAGPSPLLVTALSAAMLAVVFLVGTARRNVKG
ncbi:ABC transporter permease [Streptomyces sp. NRRL S-350]|uniref:ABC transporter permease n=1 Tax=Streptomyces sp. NRRL S-350 TaxID=1463902 RepID=UPI0004BE6016|nr:hypothetical protein [Streptomyces sp. NRRL S-350]